MTRYRNHLAAFLTLNLGVLFAVDASAAWQTNAFPSTISLKGDLYTPATPATPPAILVAIHYCTGHSSVAQGWFQSAADKNGFYIIAPDAGKQCFDSSATRGGDRDAIVKMVQWVITNKQADRTRVFAAGMSSGGCMTNTLLAIYPDVFAGGSAMPGFPAGGWPAGDITCTKCGSQPPAGDGKYWGDIARQASPWTGTYGCSQQWVGGGDEYNFNGWLPAVASQFQNLGTLDAGSAGTGAPSGWTRKVYKDAAGNVRLETNLGPSGQKHDLTGQGGTIFPQVISFLGLDKPTGACGLATSSTAGGSSGTAGAAGVAGAAGASASAGGTFSAGGVGNTAGMPSSSSGGALAGTGPTTGGTGPALPIAGSSSSAGSLATSGAPSGSSGSGSGGASAGGTKGTGGAPPDDSIGCACKAAGGSSRGSLAGLVAAGIGAFLARRRRR